MDKIEEQVIELIGEQAGINPQEISLFSKFEDLNLDSVAVVELIFMLEERFEISIPFEGLDESELKRNFYNVANLIRHLKGLLHRNV